MALHHTSVYVWPGHLSVKSGVHFTQECLDSEVTITHYHTLDTASTAEVGHCQHSSALSLYLIKGHTLELKVHVWNALVRPVLLYSYGCGTGG